MSSRWKKGALIVGIAISAILLGLFASRMDWAQFRDTFAALRWPWVFVACACFAASISVRGARWAVVAGARQSEFGAFWNAATMGYVGNALYPARAGEVIRVAVLRHSLPIPFGRIVASALGDRITDVVAVAAAAAYLVGAAAAGFAAESVLLPALVMAAVPIATLLLAGRFGHLLSPAMARMAARLPPTWAECVPRWYAEALDAVSVFARPRRMTLVLLLTAIACALDCIALWFLLRAFDWVLPAEAAILVFVLLALGSMIPAAPGYVGIYQVACVLALRPYPIPESSALAYSVVAQGAALLVIAVLGAFAGLRYGTAVRRAR